jgi:hypothetical protein
VDVGGSGVGVDVDGSGEGREVDGIAVCICSGAGVCAAQALNRTAIRSERERIVFCFCTSGAFLS